MTDLILVERDGPIATVVLNRPEKLNAMTKPMWRRLGEVMNTLSADDELRCLVLRGAGGRAFSPGNDIGEFETDRSNPEQAKAYGALMHDTITAMESSRFGVPINRLGLVMAYPEVGALVGLVGRSVALEILLEGRVFDAAEAKDKGLVTRVVPDDRIEAEAYEAARRIAAGAPLVARWHKRFAKRLEDPTALSEAELDEGYACYATEDFRIGYRAFLEKVVPEFKGR
jgi:enoyl-CoA hydratase/carnithine racemase